MSPGAAAAQMLTVKGRSSRFLLTLMMNGGSNDRSRKTAGRSAVLYNVLLMQPIVNVIV